MVVLAYDLKNRNWEKGTRRIDEEIRSIEQKKRRNSNDDTIWGAITTITTGTITIFVAIGVGVVVVEEGT